VNKYEYEYEYEYEKGKKWEGPVTNWSDI